MSALIDMDDNQLLRYSRHILLPEIGIDGQNKLLASHVLLVGAGGLGSPASLYLAASGVGKLTICDPDDVDLTNLQRQIVHTTESIGRKKVDSALDTLTRINPETTINIVPERVSGSRLESLVQSADLVVDGTDNFATRHAINRACVRFARPLVSGAAIRFDGQVSVFDLRDRESACYHCLFPEDGDLEEMRCAVMVRPHLEIPDSGFINPIHDHREQRIGWNHRLDPGGRSAQIAFRHRRNAKRAATDARRLINAMA